MKFLKNKGFKWIIVKAGNANDGPVSGSWGTNFNPALIKAAHDAGLKIFGYHFTYGGETPSSGVTTTPEGEKAVMHEIMSLNPDGLVIDAEGDWEKNPNANAVAEDYGKDFKTRYPDKFLAHAPFPYVHLHTAFPYQGFGKYVDAVMPQMYWKTISIAQTPEKIIADVDTDWKALYNQFKATGHSDSIKPIVPIGQGYDPSSTKPTPGIEVTRFYDDLRNDTDPASPFGYNGVSFWSVQHHTEDLWNAIGAGTLSAASGSISGTVFNDTNADGLQNLGETGVSGRIVYDDTNNNFVRDGNEPFATTNSKGAFTLLDRAAGTHILRQEAPNGTRQTAPIDLRPAAVEITTGQAATGVSFGTTALGKVQGSVFSDIAGNGAKDPGTDTPLRGWVVYADANHNGALDSGEIFTRSSRTGSYVLNLPAGSYDIREIDAIAGFRTTNPGLGYHPIELAAGQALTKLFGKTALTAISGYVFNDKNHDGIKQGADVGLGGWRVFVDRDGDGVWDETEESTLTDAHGRYRFGTLPAGAYRLQVLQPKTWVPTRPNTGARKIKLASGGTTSNKNFGEMPIG
jgi:hypothetical protein